MENPDQIIPLPLYANGKNICGAISYQSIFNLFSNYEPGWETKLNMWISIAHGEGLLEVDSNGFLATFEKP